MRPGVSKTRRRMGAFLARVSRLGLYRLGSLNGRSRRVRGRRGGRIGLAVTPRTLVAIFSTLALHAATRAEPVTPPSGVTTETLRINATTASTWTEGKSSVVQLDGPVVIQL